LKIKRERERERERRVEVFIRSKVRREKNKVVLLKNVK